MNTFGNFFKSLVFIYIKCNTTFRFLCFRLQPNSNNNYFETKPTHQLTLRIRKTVVDEQNEAKLEGFQTTA